MFKGVYVKTHDKSGGKRKQKVHIEYDLVGYIPVDELIKSRTGMISVMPVPRNSHNTILQPPSISSDFIHSPLHLKQDPYFDPKPI